VSPGGWNPPVFALPDRARVIRLVGEVMTDGGTSRKVDMAYAARTFQRTTIGGGTDARLRCRGSQGERGESANICTHTGYSLEPHEPRAANPML
jgi:hypothetical protein